MSEATAQVTLDVPAEFRNRFETALRDTVNDAISQLPELEADVELSEDTVRARRYRDGGRLILDQFAATDNGPVTLAGDARVIADELDWLLNSTSEAMFYAARVAPVEYAKIKREKAFHDWLLREAPRVDAVDRGHSVSGETDVVSIDVPEIEIEQWRECLARQHKHGTEATEKLAEQRHREPLPPADFLADYERRGVLGVIAEQLSAEMLKSWTGRCSGPRWALRFFVEEMVWDLSEELASHGHNPEQFMLAGRTDELHNLIDRLAWWRSEHQRLNRTVER